MQSSGKQQKDDQQFSKCEDLEQACAPDKEKTDSAEKHQSKKCLSTPVIMMASLLGIGLLIIASLYLHNLNNSPPDEPITDQPHDHNHLQQPSSS